MFARSLIVVALLGLLAGCEMNSKQTPKESAQQSWNRARAGVLYSLAKSQYENGNLDSCRKTLGDALALDPKNVPLFLMSARLSIEQGRLERAQQELQVCRALDPGNAEADYLSGVVCQRWQKHEAALEHYRQAADKVPNELSYLLAWAEMLVTLDRQAEALTLLEEKLTFFENSPAIRDAAGQLLLQAGKPEAAAAVLRQATILAPEEPSLREHLGLALYYAKDYREAAVVLERLLKDDRYAQRTDLLIALGECQFQVGRGREARESFESAAQLQPASVPAWLCLAKAALQLDDMPRADLSVRKALALEAQGAQVHLLAGYVKLKQQKFTEALAAFRKASAIDVADPVALCMCGYVLEKLGRPAEALRCYADALKLQPNDELAATLMAQIQVNE